MTMPRKPKNQEVRTREHLTPDEVERMIEVARSEKISRYGHRDATMIRVAFRHGLRGSELVNLQWSQIDFVGGKMHVNRLKKGNPATHYLETLEFRALRKLHKENSTKSPYVFLTERGGPMELSGFNKIVKRAGVLAKIGFPVHSHMLRHACGFRLANEGRDTRAIQDFLGHKNIYHTTRYTQLSAERFKGF